MVVRIKREGPLQGYGSVVEAFHAELRQAKLVEVTRRVVWVEPHFTIEQFLPCRKIEATVEELLGKYGRGASICVMPEGPQTIPYVSSAASA